MSPVGSRLRLAAGGLVLVGLAALASPPAVAAPADNGQIRLAHLSPDTPEVDVYLTAFARPDSKVVLRGVGYGAVSPYQAVPPGRYTVSMRLAGAAESTPAVLSTNVEVASNAAYTVAGVGKQAQLGLRIIADDLTPPPAGRAKVRVLNASVAAPAVDVVGNTRVVLASDARFTATTDYQAVRSGPWEVVVRPADNGAALGTESTSFAAGGVYSLVVLDSGDDVTVSPLQDVSGAPVLPAGGVDAGLGGTASAAPVAIPLALLMLLMLLVAALTTRSARGDR